MYCGRIWRDVVPRQMHSTCGWVPHSESSPNSFHVSFNGSLYFSLCFPSWKNNRLKTNSFTLETLAKHIVCTRNDAEGTRGERHDACHWGDTYCDIRWLNDKKTTVWSEGQGWLPRCFLSPGILLFLISGANHWDILSLGSRALSRRCFFTQTNQRAFSKRDSAGTFVSLLNTRPNHYLLANLNWAK